ncbi:MAG: DUF6282 family protein, partial [Chloroflexota bacterium]
MVDRKAQSQQRRASAKPEDGLSLQQILQIEVPDDRVERLKTLAQVDIPGISEEIRTFLIRQQAQFANIQYARFLAGTKCTEQDVDDILTNSIDIHVHGGSDPMERLLLEDDIAVEYTNVGMRAMVVKTWYSPSATRNPLVQKAADSYAEERGLRPVQCFGGITLNYSVGGFNPEAVKKCLAFTGMKYVWMPMVDSYHHRRVVYDDWSGFGLNFLDEQKKVIPAVQEILRIVADNDLILGTGHYPYEDSAILFEEARRLGVTRMEVVHPAHMHSKHTIAQMKEQAARGAKLMLSGLGTMAFPLHESGPVYAARIVKEVGPENVVYGSDLNQFQNFPPAAGARWMVKLLLAYGCTKEELYQVFQVAPARHLGLEMPPPMGTPAHPGWPRHDGSKKYAGYPQADPSARARANCAYEPECLDEGNGTD